MRELADGEVMGIDTDGCLICWDALKKFRYNSGETIQEYGAQNLTEIERNRLTSQGILLK
jgi:hypothetical protein